MSGHLTVPRQERSGENPGTHWKHDLSEEHVRAKLKQSLTDCYNCISLTFLHCCCHFIAEMKDCNSNKGATALVVPSFVPQTWSVVMSPWWHLGQDDWGTFLHLENIPLQYKYCNNLLNFLDHGKEKDGKVEQSWDWGLKNISACCCCQEQNLACDVGGSLN